jgi:hypothetical protein
MTTIKDNANVDPTWELFQTRRNTKEVCTDKKFECREKIVSTIIVVGNKAFNENNLL